MNLINQNIKYKKLEDNDRDGDRHLCMYCGTPFDIYKNLKYGTYCCGNCKNKK